MRNGLDLYRGQPTIFKMMSDFDRLFDRAVVSPWVVGEIRDLAGEDKEWFEPKVEFQENDEGYFMSFDVPGVRKEDLKIDLNGRKLTISGERKRQDGTTRMYGKFLKELTLPEAIDSEKIEAKLEDGVLAVALPKATSAKPRSIEIGTGKPSFFSKLIGANSDQKTEA